MCVHVYLNWILIKNRARHNMNQKKSFESSNSILDKSLTSYCFQKVNDCSNEKYISTKQNDDTLEKGLSSYK